MTPQNAFYRLIDYSSHLEDIEYYEILSLMRSIGRLPIPIARIPPGVLIDRARKNIGECLFSSVDQLSYIKDPQVIRDHLLEFGRANKPHEVMFYGAIESTLVRHQRITAIAETSALWQDEQANSTKGELYTVSRWMTTRELFVAEVVFSSEALRINPDTQRAFRRQAEFLQRESNEQDIEFFRQVIMFISEQFARKKKTHHDYKISTAYADLILNIAKLDGVAFPSVQTGYQGQNLALPPRVVDDGLDVEVLTVQRLHKYAGNMRLNNIKNCETPRNCKQSLIWIDLDPLYTYSHEQIAAELGVDISEVIP